LNPNYNKFGNLSDGRERLIDNERDSDSDDDALFDEGCLLSENNNPSNFSATGYVVASARHTVATSCNYISSAISATVQHHIKNNAASIAMLTDDAECCADTGATDHMLPDYDAFYSYHKCSGRFVTLGDSTKLPIHGFGTFSFEMPFMSQRSVLPSILSDVTASWKVVVSTPTTTTVILSSFLLFLYK
jgi:hypothetical protein